MAVLDPVSRNYGRLKNYVNGEWVDSGSSKALEVRDPATTDVIAQVPLSTKEETKAAIETAQEAWWSWRETAPGDRTRCFFKLKTIMEREYENIARIISQEQGKTIDDARGETRRCIDNVDVAAGITSLQMGYNLEDGAASNIDEEVIVSPLGVFAAVCPFNFPGMVPFWFWPYAVATGNMFIVKPSEQVPITTQYMFKLIDQAGFPPGVINLVNGREDAVNTFFDHKDIKGISFVGSTPVAKWIYKTAGEKGKKVQAQGGAKNSLVVMPDAVLDKTVNNMLASFYGCAGQRCLAGSNMIAIGDVAEPLLKKWLDASRNLKVGCGLDEASQMGPVISAAAKEKVLGYIQKGVDEGAKLLLDGRGIKVPGFEKGHFIGPTVFDDVTPDMTIAKEEIFGPVVCFHRMKNLDEAIEFIHQSPFGNASSIYTQSGKLAREFRYRCQVGNVGINVGLVAAMAYFPFAGYKDSFFGDLHGQGQDAVKFFSDR
ncbi:MAG: malonate-semialdehyde dehydrogenase (acetylating) / methylmalonate-semialdehyde dehydrogenase [Candidatus Thermoplasmatota archaeon]|nr:malonate-semialdehyde dehydrogenase (acetylating) / methylmalonate-semialdehyde dehydrogenase [Candidatus Thermoplasmatota archaeon]